MRKIRSALRGSSFGPPAALMPPRTLRFGRTTAAQSGRLAAVQLTARKHTNVRNLVVGLTVATTLAVLSGGLAAAAVGHGVFYLSVHPRECLIGSPNSGSGIHKTVFVVPCSNPKHNLEVYAVGHGGWGHGTPPPVKTELATGRTICWAAYQRITGHPLGSHDGWAGFWPDPGAETARYGDKIICSYRSWPGFHALGAGRHVR